MQSELLVLVLIVLLANHLRQNCKQTNVCASKLLAKYAKPTNLRGGGQQEAALGLPAEEVGPNRPCVGSAGR